MAAGVLPKVVLRCSASSCKGSQRAPFAGLSPFNNLRSENRPTNAAAGGERPSH